MYDIEEDSDRGFIAMEFLDGKTLQEVVQEGPLEASRLVSIAIQVLMAWRRPTPRTLFIATSNWPTLFVTRQGRVKMVDFGWPRSRRAVMRVWVRHQMPS